MANTMSDYSVEEELDKDELEDQIEELEMEIKKKTFLLLIIIATNSRKKKKSKRRKRDLKRAQYVRQ